MIRLIMYANTVHAMNQAVSHWPVTAQAWLQSGLVGFWLDRWHCNRFFYAYFSFSYLCHSPDAPYALIYPLICAV